MNCYSSGKNNSSDIMNYTIFYSGAEYIVILLCMHVFTDKYDLLWAAFNTNYLEDGNTVCETPRNVETIVQFNLLFFNQLDTCKITIYTCFFFIGLFITIVSQNLRHALVHVKQ